MYKYIIHPKTKKYIKTKSKLGFSLLKKYLYNLLGGSYHFQQPINNLTQLDSFIQDLKPPKTSINLKIKNKQIFSDQISPGQFEKFCTEKSVKLESL